MSKIYVIDDQYLKNNYPSLNSYSDVDLLSVIMIEQITSLKQVLSADTYDALLVHIGAGTVADEWVDLLELSQLYLMFRSVQGVFDLYSKNTDIDTRDNNVANVYGKIKFAEANLKTFLADSDITTGDEFSSDYVSTSPFYYPR